MGRPSNTTERRQEIVAGLREVLAEKGYAGASIADIARAAGLNAGLVHYHFSDKRAVLLALVEDLVARLRARIAARDEAGPGARERLLAFVDAAVGLGPDADEAAVACWIGVCAEAVRDAEVRAAVERATTLLTDDLTARVRAALVEADAPGSDARRHAALLWSTIQGSFLLAVTAPGVVPRGSMAPLVRALVEDLLDRAHTGRKR